MSTHYATVKLSPQDAPKRAIYLYWPRHGYYEVRSSYGRESYTWLGAEDEVEVLSKGDEVVMGHFMDDQEIEGHAKTRATGQLAGIKLPSEDKVIRTDRDIRVPVGDGAMMTVPRPDWLWKLCHVRPEPNRGTKCDDRMLVVSSLESYLYLIENCTKEEAWKRIKAMRHELRQFREEERGK